MHLPTLVIAVFAVLCEALSPFKYASLSSSISFGSPRTANPFPLLVRRGNRKSWIAIDPISSSGRNTSSHLWIPSGHLINDGHHNIEIADGRDKQNTRNITQSALDSPGAFSAAATTALAGKLPITSTMARTANTSGSTGMSTVNTGAARTKAMAALLIFVAAAMTLL